MPINGEGGRRMEKVIAQTSKWKVTLKETVIEVDLYDLVYSEREVVSILDAYKKAVDIRHWEVKKFGRTD
jgi:cell division GTPase FtsZ